LINFAKSDNTKDNPRMQDKNKNKNKIKIYKNNDTLRGIDGMPSTRLVTLILFYIFRPSTDNA